MTPDMTADAVIAHLDLAPHPEGGFYRQTWADETTPRALGTAIYFLLKDGAASHWHRVDAAEMWHFYAGAPLVLSVSETEAGPARDLTLGPDLTSGALPQLLVPTDHWQAARTTGAWTLVGCTVVPGFRFEGLEMADQGFDITR